MGPDSHRPRRAFASLSLRPGLFRIPTQELVPVAAYHAAHVPCVKA